MSTIPHTHIEFANQPCVFTLAQAMAGVSFSYDLVIDEDVPGFVASPPYDYGPDAAGLEISEQISGGIQLYCVCDRGLPFQSCPLDDGGKYFPGFDAGTCNPITLPKGAYHRVLDWDGRNWYGPSDTGQREGPPFPPGDYAFKVEAKGKLANDGGADNVGVTAQFRISLLP
jgi:hypothetical protein